MFKQILLAIMICSSSVCTFAASGPEDELAPLSCESPVAVLTLLDLIKVNSEVNKETVFIKANFIQLVSTYVQALYSKGAIASSVSITDYGLSTSPKKELKPEMRSACDFLIDLVQQLDFGPVYMSKELFETYIDRLKYALQASNYSLEGIYFFDGTRCIFREN